MLPHPEGTEPLWYTYPAHIASPLPVEFAASMSEWEGMPERDCLLDQAGARPPISRVLFVAKCSKDQEEVRADMLGHFEASASPLDFSGVLVFTGPSVFGVVEVRASHTARFYLVVQGPGFP